MSLSISSGVCGTVSIIGRTSMPSGAAFDLLHLARAETQDVVPHRMRHLLERVLDALDLREHLRLIDIALLGDDADRLTFLPPNTSSSRFVVSTYACVCGAQRSGLESTSSLPSRRRQENGDAEDSQDHDQAMRGNPARVGAEPARFSDFH